MRSDDRDLRDVAAERQQAVVVLEQRHRFSGEPPGQIDALARHGANFDRVLADVRIVEEAESRLVAQDVAHGPIEQRLGDLPVAYRPGQHLPVAVHRRCLDIHAGREGQRSCFLWCWRDLLPRMQEPDSHIVRHGRSREAHAAAQQVRQHRFRRGDRHAVELRVARHDGRKPRQPKRRFERTRVDVVELPRADSRRGHVLASFGHRVADEVLRRRQHALGQVLPSPRV